MGRSGPTEDTPATPSWVEDRLDRIIGALPVALAAAMQPERDAYLDCLAKTNGPADPMLQRQACHAGLMARLRRLTLPSDTLDALHQTLEALEAELGADT